MKRETKKRIRQFVIILGIAVVLRVTTAILAPFEMQRYFSFGILLASIASFFTWDYIRMKREEKQR